MTSVEKNCMMVALRAGSICLVKLAAMDRGKIRTCEGGLCETR